MTHNLPYILHKGDFYCTDCGQCAVTTAQLKKLACYTDLVSPGLPSWMED